MSAGLIRIFAIKFKKEVENLEHCCLRSLVVERAAVNREVGSSNLPGGVFQYALRLTGDSIFGGRGVMVA